jgi:hypothetical protein
MVYGPGGAAQAVAVSSNRSDEKIGLVDPGGHCKVDARKPIEPARLRLLAGRIHRLGPYPLYHLLRELADGAPLGPCLKAYAALAPLASFIEAHGGRELPPPVRLVGGAS